MIYMSFPLDHELFRDEGHHLFICLSQPLVYSNICQKMMTKMFFIVWLTFSFWRQPKEAKVGKEVEVLIDPQGMANIFDGLRIVGRQVYKTPLMKKLKCLQHQLLVPP